MRALKSSARPLYLLLVISILGLQLAGVASAQQEQREERDRLAELQEKRPKAKFNPRGFGGIKAAEAAEAQNIFDQGMALQADGKLDAALKRYKSVYKKYPRSAVAPQAFYQSAIIYRDRGQGHRAFEAFDTIVRAYPDFGRFNELISEEYKIAYDYISGRADKLFGVLPGFSNRERGIQYFERMVYAAPYSDYAPLALMNIANEFARAGQPEAAIAYLDRLITNYPNSLVTSDGFLRLAQVHESLVAGPLYDQENTREAMEAYEDYIILFPRAPSVGDAETGLARMKEMLAESRIRIANFYFLKRSNFKAARVCYNEAITISPTSDAAQKARERLAQVDVEEAKMEARRAELAAKGPSLVDRVLRRRPVSGPMVAPGEDKAEKPPAEKPAEQPSVVPNP